jgi:hypothetical protein
MVGVADGTHAHLNGTDGADGADRHGRIEYERLRAEFLQTRAEYERLAEQEGTPASQLRALQERMATQWLRIRAWRAGG